MPADFREDLTFEAENRRRRRLGMSEQGVPPWPTPEFEALEADLYGFALANAALVPQRIVASYAKLFLSAPATPGEQAEALKQGRELLSEARLIVARATSSREPGEEG